MIVVYSKPQCMACDQTKKWLERKGLAFEEKALADHLDVLEEAKASGIMSAPICVTDQGSAWGGMNLDKLREYEAAERYKEETQGGVDTPISVS